ncbi:9428_t:CDS:2, partial [Gigaspora rosea]
KKICTTWDPNLSKVYPWLEKYEDNDSVVIVFCTRCKAAKKVNQFTEGTKQSQTTIIQGFTRQLNDQKLKIISLMRNVYYLSKGNQAMNQYPALCQLGYLQFINHEELYFENNPIVLKSIDNETFNKCQHEYASYENTISERAFFASIAFVIEHEIIQELLENCNTESITNNLERFIIAKSLNIENLTHFGSDGASTMLGQCTGVATHAAEQVAYFKTYDTIVKGIYLYFSSSYKSLLTLKMVQQNLEEPELVLLNIISTRWLSFSNVIHNFHQCLESIKGALLEEAANNQQAASLLAN